MNDLILHRRLIMALPITAGGYIEGVYNITNNTSATKLLGFNAGLMSMIYGMEIDDVSIIPVSEYIFETLGEHKVRFYIAYVFSALNMFKDCNSLVSVTFNVSRLINVNLDSAFHNCQSLKTVDWGDEGIYVKDITNTFKQCTSLQTIDLSKIDDNFVTMFNTFYGADAETIKLGNRNQMYLRGTFFNLGQKIKNIDLTGVVTITQYSQPFNGCNLPDELNFGECDLSRCRVDKHPFFEFTNSETKGRNVIMLGKPMQYPNVISILDKMEGNFIYNPKYDYSPIFYIHPRLNPIIHNDAPTTYKTFSVRFCTNNEWVVDDLATFIINNVKGEYTSKGIWKFKDVIIDNYKYPIYYGEEIIGEIIAKEDIQQIAFGNNDLVYKVIDLSTKNSFNIQNDNWGWAEDMDDIELLYIENGYSGYTHKKINIGEQTSFTLETNMVGEIVITAAQDSQVNFYYCNVTTDNTKYFMLGPMHRSHEIKFRVLTTDGVIKFTYNKIYNDENPPNAIGLDRVFIKKIENYNWPLIPE